MRFDGRFSNEKRRNSCKDRGCVRIKLRSTITNSGPEGQIQSLSERTTGVAHRKVENVGADGESAPLAGIRVKLGSGTRRRDAMEIPTSSEQLRLHLGLPQQDAHFGTRQEVLELLGIRKPARSRR